MLASDGTIMFSVTTGGGGDQDRRGRGGQGGVLRIRTLREQKSPRARVGEHVAERIWLRYRATHLSPTIVKVAGSIRSTPEQQTYCWARSMRKCLSVTHCIRRCSCARSSLAWLIVLPA